MKNYVEEAASKRAPKARAIIYVNRLLLMTGMLIVIARLSVHSKGIITTNLIWC